MDLDSILNDKRFWYLFNTGTALSWFFVLVGVICPYGGFFKVLWFILILVFGIIHPLEVKGAIPIGKKAGFSPETTIFGTLIFGFGWWLPVKKGVFTS